MNNLIKNDKAEKDLEQAVQEYIRLSRKAGVCDEAILDSLNDVGKYADFSDN